MGFEKVIYVDGKGHLLGRLAAVVAKELLNGQKVVVLRCESLERSGSLFRNKLQFEAFLRKKSNTNPSKHSHIHYTSPSMMFRRTVRGMLPHKTARGAEALKRLEVYEGVPTPFAQKKRMVVPQALRIIKLKPSRDFCKIGDLSAKFGWKHGALIKRLEAARQEKATAWHKAKVVSNKAISK